MSRPVIGLSTYRELARWGPWDQSADLLPTVYALAIEAAGGVPLLLPPTAPYAEAATAVVARLDGLVISGGADMSPERYGQRPHERTTSWREDRDAWEVALLDVADEAGQPLLGVCRGMQVMAVHAGALSTSTSRTWSVTTATTPEPTPSARPRWRWSRGAGSPPCSAPRSP